MTAKQAERETSRLCFANVFPAQKVRIRRPTLLTIYRRLRRVRPPANIAGDLRH